MPAKGLHNEILKDGSYSHVYNKGVENRVIFNDGQDYEVFLSYLKDYLTAPLGSEATKKTFTVHGRTFRGTPHQPKNYLGKIELIAYGLLPSSFHLLLYQKTPGTLEGFIRSLCTRYSIYYNKKYHRSGALLNGPYKSAEVKDISQLLLLTRHLHRNIHSSYPEYLGKRQSQWVNTNIVLSVMGLHDYKRYVEKYKPNEKEKGLLDAVSLENGALERRKLESIATDTPKAGPVANLKPSSRLPEILGMSVFFLLLTGLGLRNINVSNAKNVVASATTEPSVLSTSTQPTELPQPTDVPIPTDLPQPKNTVVVKIADGARSVNIRQGPTTHSEKVDDAYEGDTFEFFSVDSGWYEIKLTGGATGYISSMYAFPVEPTNQND